MTSKEMFQSLYDLTDDKPEIITISDRYVCEFKSILTRSSRIRRPDHFQPYFTVLIEDKNSCLMTTYANMLVYDTVTHKNYFGRLHMNVCNDLSGENAHSFMLYLKDDEDAKFWNTSISIPASSIQLKI